MLPRSALAAVDGSAAATGLTPKSSRVFDHRRTRSDSSVRIFVDGEFREDRSRSRGMRDHHGATAGSVESVTSGGYIDGPLPGNAGFLDSSGSVFGGEVCARPAEVEGRSEETPMDVEMDDGPYGNENDLPEDRPMHVNVQAPPANPGSIAPASMVASLGVAGAFSGWERVALRDVVLEVPEEYQEQDYSDIESDEGDEGDEEMQSENLAEQLEERIRQNTGGFYDFDIYCDP